MSLKRVNPALPDTLALEHDSDDSILDDLFSTSSDDEQEQAPPPVPPASPAGLEDVERFERLGLEVFDALEREPDDPEDRIAHLFFFTVQCLIINYLIPDGTEYNACPVPSDSDAVVRFKAFLMFTKDCHDKFIVLMSTIRDNILQYVESVIPTHAPRVHNFLRLLAKHKELHSRRIKIDPAQTRTKNDNISTTVNLITNEVYNPDDDDHKSWMTLVFVPLDSDYNEDAIDAKEGGKEHALAIEVDKLLNKNHVPDPFFFVVTKEWDKIFRMVHSLNFFYDYLNVIIYGTISAQQDAMLRRFKQEDWHGQWEYLVGEEFSNVSIKKFRNEKKSVPKLVSEMAEYRDYLRAIVHFSLSVEKKK